MIITKDKILELLADARRKGIHVHLNEGNLRLKVDKNQSVDPKVLDALKADKEAIINFLLEEENQLSEIRKGTQGIPVYDKTAYGRIPLSYAQEELWLLDKLQGSRNYHASNVFRIDGKVQPDLLAQTLRTIIDRHEVLRTVLSENEDSTAFQEIKESDSWQMKNSSASEKELNDILQEDLELTFDLNKDLLVRAHLIRLAEDKHILHIVMHHLVFDGWSMPIFFTELAEIYEKLAKNQDPGLQKLPIQYADYAIWQRENLTPEKITDMLQYWVQKLEGYQVTDLITDYPRPPVRSIAGKTETLTLDQQLSDSLRTLASAEKVSLFVLTLAAFKILIYKYTGEKDICLGTTVANRDKQGLEKLIGLFVNMLPLRTVLNEGQPTGSFIQEVKETVHESFSNKDVPFEKIVNKVESQRDRSRNPIFQMIFVYQGKQGVVNDSVNIGDLAISKMSTDNEITKYDIAFNISEKSDGKLLLDIGYSTDLFRQETVKELLHNYRELLQSITEDREQLIENLRLVPKEDIPLLANEPNNTFTEFPTDKSLIDLIEHQTDQSPEKTSVVFGRTSITFRELSEKSNSLANYLLDQHAIKKGDAIGLSIDRSQEMIISIIAV
ncbi:MAG: condensation domain-containing protein, partial [Cyclobacteriaceae bacterium]